MGVYIVVDKLEDTRDFCTFWYNNVFTYNISRFFVAHFHLSPIYISYFCLAMNITRVYGNEKSNLSLTDNSISCMWLFIHFQDYFELKNCPSNRCCRIEAKRELIQEKSWFFCYFYEHTNNEFKPIKVWCVILAFYVLV